jgi:polysaccharide deacetylase 2 family uncharacterized protein YibQ
LVPTGPAPESAGPTTQKESRILRHAAAAVFLFLSLVLVFLAAGCKRERAASRLNAVQTHQITQELAKAAADLAPGRTVVKIHRFGASAGSSADELYIGLPAGAATVARVEQGLEGVAGDHGLTVDPEARNGNSVKLALRSRGSVTHRIEIEELPVAGASAAPGSPRLAILLDDLGSDRNAADAIFALQIPLTISVLPYHAHSEEIAEVAHQHGCEVMLHLPMQSVANESPEQVELKPGLPPDQVRSTVEKMLESVPQADGVNNHQGSQATANARLMGELMRVLKDDGMFYVDSRTTAATVAYDIARREGVKTAFRNVPFLDDVQDKNAVKRQLETAIAGAKQKGEAIAIGHPHTATLEALRELLPQARKQGVQLVLVSELVR